MKTSETRVLDINAEALGVSADRLMETAGTMLAEEIDNRFGKGEKTIAIVCGTGNNGGDGFVAARKLDGLGWKVKILMVKDVADTRGEVAKNKLAAIPETIEIIESACPVDWDDCEIILDCVLGTGISGKIRPPFKSWISSINEGNKTIISADVPSGLGADISVKPVLTVSFHDAKEGMTPENSGQIVIRDIGIPKEAEENIGLGDLVYYPRPYSESHKGDNGKLLIIGGGPYTGAPALAAMGALAAGADLVTIATPEHSWQVIASFSPNFIVRPFEGKILEPGHVSWLLELSSDSDAVLIGPGLGRDEQTLAAVRDFVKKCFRPLVIDADGLNALAGHLDILQSKTGVLTPHAGEFMRLASVKEDNSVLKLARDTKFTILLKGKIDIISDGQNTKKNLTGNEAMTVGGTGDVLAGVVAGLISKSAEPFPAARMGAFINGAAGDIAFEKLGYSLKATDVIDNIPMVLKTSLNL